MTNNRTEQILVINVDGRRCGIPVAFVREIVRAVTIEPLPGAPDHVDGLCRVRGRLVPVVSMRKHLHLTDRPVRSTDYFVVTEMHGETVALRVDDVVDLQAAPILDAPFGARSMGGVIEVSDGIVVVHDVHDTLAPQDLEALAFLMEATTYDPGSSDLMFDEPSNSSYEDECLPPEPDAEVKHA